jgi:hypothetical protein
MNFLSEKLKALVLDYFPTGSRIICNPPVMNTDEDFVLITSDLSKFNEEAASDGWQDTATENYDIDSSGFNTFRKGDKNLIVTVSFELFRKWLLATLLARKLNLTDKEDRKDLFAIVTEDRLHVDSLIVDNLTTSDNFLGYV